MALSILKKFWSYQEPNNFVVFCVSRVVKALSVIVLQTPVPPHLTSAMPITSVFSLSRSLCTCCGMPAWYLVLIFQVLLFIHLWLPVDPTPSVSGTDLLQSFESVLLYLLMCVFGRIARPRKHFGICQP